MRTYHAVIHKAPGTSYGISFPDFPGCISAGDNCAEAIASGMEALELHIEGMLEDGLEMPEPRSLEGILDDPDWNDGAIIAIEAPRPKGRAVRVNVTIDEHLLADIDRQARAEGKSRSGFLADAASERLSRLARERAA